MVFWMDVRVTHLEKSRVRNIRFLRVTVIMNEKIMFIFCFSQPDKIDFYRCRTSTAVLWIVHSLQFAANGSLPHLANSSS